VAHRDSTARYLNSGPTEVSGSAEATSVIDVADLRRESRGPGPWPPILFVVPTVTYRLLFLVVILAHDRRRIVHVAVTAHPTAWRAQQLREAFPEDTAPRFLIHDRDIAFAGLARAIRGMGIEEVGHGMPDPSLGGQRHASVSARDAIGARADRGDCRGRLSPSSIRAPRRVARRAVLAIATCPITLPQMAARSQKSVRSVEYAFRPRHAPNLSVRSSSNDVVRVTDPDGDINSRMADRTFQ